MPHGSKKLTDLIKLKERYKHDDLWSFYTTPYMICHDQEPLNYELYQDPNLLDHDYDGIGRKRMFSLFTPQDWIDFKRDFGNINLRIAINPWMNIFDKIILLHSEKNSKQVQRYNASGFEPAYWFSHASISRDWFRYAEYDPGFKKSNITKDFLIYNRAWSGTREYRLKFAELLIDHDMINNCLTSFQPWCDDQHYTNHSFDNLDFGIKSTNLESHYKLNTFNATASADYDLDDYNSTHIEVVLETLFDDSRWQLTEKIFRPIACGQPFLLASTSGSLKYLRSYGFKTFAPWINENYDDVIDAKDRLSAIVVEMKRIAALNPMDKQNLLGHCVSIAKYNKDLFFSESFLTNILHELKQNITTAHNQIMKTAQGSFFKKFLAFRKPHIASESYSVFSKELLNWLETRYQTPKI